MEIFYHKYELILKTPFQLSYGLYDRRTTFIIQLSEKQLKAYGEVVSIDYYNWTIPQIENDINTLIDLIKKNKTASKKELRQLINKKKQILIPVRSAFDCALWDLQSREENKALRDLLGSGSDEHLPLSSYTISGTDIDSMSDQISQCSWPIIKLKMGNKNDNLIAKILGEFPEKIFRIDANAGWNIEKVKDLLELLNPAQIEFIEQPFPVKDMESLEWMKSISEIPIMADEACQDLDDVSTCFPLYDAINIKLMKCGGISNALEMIRCARKYALKIMIGCMTESSCGISAAAQLIHLVDYADLDGASLLKNDPAKGVEMINGNIILNNRSGIGADLIKI
jgi:L-alanine-DL-glutamate epimerase-like enolase superfamily enzyme